MHKNKFMKCFITGLLCVLCITIQAQNITGETTSSSKILPYVNVFLKGTKKGAVSNDDGMFKISNVKPGTYTIIASFTGYQTQKKTITVSKNDIKISFLLYRKIYFL